jgi:hypothetical protein
MLSSVARTEKRLTIVRLILNHQTDFSLIVWGVYSVTIRIWIANFTSRCVLLTYAFAVCRTIIWPRDRTLLAGSCAQIRLAFLGLTIRVLGCNAFRLFLVFTHTFAPATAALVS